MLQVMSEQCINIEQLILQRDEVVTQNRQLMWVVDEAYQMVPELAIHIEEPTEVHVRKLAARVCEAKKEMTRVQLELNLQIVKLQLKA